METELQDPEELHAELLASGASGEHFFRGVKLEPFSWGRLAALQRLLFEELSDEETKAAIVYLCTLPSEQVGAIRGEVARHSFLAAMEAWVEAQGARPGTSAGASLMATGERIWLEYTAAQTEPDMKAGAISAGESSQAG